MGFSRLTKSRQFHNMRPSIVWKIIEQRNLSLKSAPIPYVRADPDEHPLAIS